jgi:hypothetical protein
VYYQIYSSGFPIHFYKKYCSYWGVYLNILMKEGIIALYHLTLQLTLLTGKMAII